MGKRLPPLHALRAFEAVARHNSVSKAAEELHVSHSAISQHIKTLEAYLDIFLLERQPGKIQLSEAGKLYAFDLSIAFNKLKEATDKITIENKENILTVAFPSTFAMRWFIPRMEDFQLQHPDIEIRLLTINQEINFSQEAADVAIYIGKEPKNLRAYHLFSDEIYPVCHPKLLTKYAGKSLPANWFALQKYIYVEAALRKNDWEIWLSAAKLAAPSEASKLYFQNTLQALQAAQNGLGLVLARDKFIENELSTGQLVSASELKVGTGNHYYLVFPESYYKKRKIKLFKTWLLKAIRVQ